MTAFLGQMSLGEKAQLVIASDYAYGAAGQGPIPPNSDVSLPPYLAAVRACCVLRADFGGRAIRARWISDQGMRERGMSERGG